VTPRAPGDDRDETDRDDVDRGGRDRDDVDRGGVDRRPDDRIVTPGDRLLLDAMLGKLATYLRMCGYDAAYALDRDVEADDDLLSLAGAEDRRIVTRDRSLAERAPGAVLVTSPEVLDQLRELRDEGFDVSLAEKPTRCGRCNGPIEPVAFDDSGPERVDESSPEGTDVARSGARDRPAYVPDDADPVWRCRECGQHFWRGSHWADVRERLRHLDE
jgi:hypothetical protein